MCSLTVEELSLISCSEEEQMRRSFGVNLLFYGVLGLGKGWKPKILVLVSYTFLIYCGIDLSVCVSLYLCDGRILGVAISDLPRIFGEVLYQGLCYCFTFTILENKGEPLVLNLFPFLSYLMEFINFILFYYK